jgi:hypothetical protein
MTLREPFPRTRGGRPVVVWLAVMLVLFAVLAALDLALRDGGAEGIVPFELAGTSERAREITGAWGPAGRRTAAASLLVDYGFLVAYGVFLALAAGALGRALAHRPRLAGAGILLAWAALAAAGADALENVALLAVVAGADGDPLPAVATGFAVVKFALVALVNAWLLGGLLILRRHRRRQSL